MSIKLPWICSLFSLVKISWYSWHFAALIVLLIRSGAKLTFAESCTRYSVRLYFVQHAVGCGSGGINGGWNGRSTLRPVFVQAICIIVWELVIPPPPLNKFNVSTTYHQYIGLLRFGLDGLYHHSSRLCEVSEIVRARWSAFTPTLKNSILLQYCCNTHKNSSEAQIEESCSKNYCGWQKSHRTHNSTDVLGKV